MSEFLGVITNIGATKMAASIGGAAINLTVIRFGDGNGAPIVPSPTMTDLVRRVGAACPITEAGPDPDYANHWRVTTVLAAETGPFDIREIAVFDAAGDMFAIARHPLVEKRTFGQGAAVELTTDVVFPISPMAQITIQFNSSSYATQGYVDGHFLPRDEAEEDYLTKAEAAATYAANPQPFHFFSMI